MDKKDSANLHWVRVLSGLYHKNIEPLCQYLQYHRYIADPYLRLIVVRLANSGPQELGFQLAEGDRKISKATLRTMMSERPIPTPQLLRLCKALKGMPGLPQLAIRKHPSLSKAERGPVERMRFSRDRRKVANFLAEHGMSDGTRKRALGAAQEFFGVGETTLKAIWAELGEVATKRERGLKELREIAGRQNLTRTDGELFDANP